MRKNLVIQNFEIFMGLPVSHDISIMYNLSHFKLDVLRLYWPQEMISIVLNLYSPNKTKLTKFKRKFNLENLIATASLNSNTLKLPSGVKAELVKFPS